MLDLVIRNAVVLDGTGAPGRRADVAVKDGRIVAVGEVTGAAARTIDAAGRCLTPGYIDPHTHYDAQVLWDPHLTPSSNHGVTTVISGNCGFSVAPLKDEDAVYTLEMLSRVEGMPLPALLAGVDKTWTSFGEYLDRVDATTAVNAAFLVGHNALRRYVMGADAVGHEATPEQVDAMRALLAESLRAGGLGLSTSRSASHSDGDGQPVSSRWATEDEVLTLCEEVGRHDGTTLEVIVPGCLDMFTPEEVALLTEMSVRGNRRVNWNVMTVNSEAPTRHLNQIEASTKAAANGGTVIALTMPSIVSMNMSFGTFCALHLIPGWGEVMALPYAERMVELRKPEVRAALDTAGRAKEAGVYTRLTHWHRYEIGDTYSEANRGLSGRLVGDIATERGQSPFDCLVDIVLADDLRTVLWPLPSDDDELSWALRATVWSSEYVMLGGSDAGAHLDRMQGAQYPAQLLADCIRGRKLTTIENAVRLMTDVPARHFGLVDRGRIAPGYHADLVIFDPETVGTSPIRVVADLPGGCARLVADPSGFEHIFVNGVETWTDGERTGEAPGKVLRSGVDTRTVTVR
jgi:N-acyl-D-aspartate/D-glutamate deacylase